jgi:hypothetical protein
MDKPWLIAIQAIAASNLVDDPVSDVIVQWLYEGDTRPLAWAIDTGEALSPKVLAMLSLMLSDDAAMPFSLVTKKRKAGRPASPEAFIRDKLIGAQIELWIDKGLTYEFVIDMVARIHVVSPKTAEDAYTKWKAAKVSE